MPGVRAGHLFFDTSDFYPCFWGGFYPSFGPPQIAVITYGWVRGWVGGMARLMDLPLSNWGYGRAPFQLGIWTGPFLVGDPQTSFAICYGVEQWGHCVLHQSR